jgi:aminobenzoyl-glutamate utilization protein B
VEVAGKTIASTLLELLGNPGAVAAARAEFAQRTGGARFVAPLLPKDFMPPLEYRWPEYVTTPRGADWWIPACAELEAPPR